MKTHYSNQPASAPKVSLVLLDWSCRESFHILEYLRRQLAPRGDFEVIWVEYYSRRAPGIQRLIDEAVDRAHLPPVDLWISLGIPERTYYHKHLMYNAGIVLARGRIVVFCDSDAMVRPTFVSSIIESFEEDPAIVLHLDEIRNTDRTLYPFSFPPFERVLGDGCINWNARTTTGLQDNADPIHTRNYGACFCARREDLIAIGGADEHIDYLGHVCGPYELTFRLRNFGRREVWHQTEFLYHTWHPGTEGQDNYMGPHDGRNVSTTALRCITSGRVLPLVENAAIRQMRLAPAIQICPPEDSLIPLRDIERWSTPRPNGRARLPRRLKPILLWMLAAQIWQKARNVSETHKRKGPSMRKGPVDTLLLGLAFIARMWRNNEYAAETCLNVADDLRSKGEPVLVYGHGPLSHMLRTALQRSLGPLFVGTARPTGCPSDLPSTGRIVIGDMTDIAAREAELERAGVAKRRIIRLQ